MDIACTADAHAGKKITKNTMPAEGGCSDEQGHECSAEDGCANVDRAADAAELWR